MRIVSLLPSATEIVCALGLEDELVGITHECDYPPGIANKKTVCIESCLGAEGKSLPPGEIEIRIKQALEAGEGVYRFLPGVLEALQPDLIVTQGLCDVCALPYRTVEQVVASLPNKPDLLSLDPTDVTGILADIRRVGEATGRIVEAGDLVAALEERIGRIVGVTQDVKLTRPRVACIEWVEPLYAAGHWVPEMVEMAGGIDVLGKVGEPSERIGWDAFIASQPELIVLMPCGYSAAEAQEQLPLLQANPRWNQLPEAAREKIYTVDANDYFSRPGPRVVDGLEQLACLLHPELFSAGKEASAVASAPARP